VNAAVLGESRWGAAKYVSDCLYITVGTGIGGGAIAGGRVLHGLTHTEMGHVRILHDLAEDAFPGMCPYHGDCLEGLASGPAMEARWGKPALELPDDHPAWQLEAKYIALGVTNFICTLSPELIVIGGGVMKQAQLYVMIRQEVERLLNGYMEKLPPVVPPGLGDLAGVLGAIALASEETA
jgi:fructokinase